ncbi:methyltransferase regulatory domain-containing protein, partial [Singulisphaera rosea]
GLGFLAEARAPGLVELLPPDALELLDRWAEDEIAREQYADFLCNRTFRRTLIYHERLASKQPPSPDTLSTLWLSTTLQPVSEQPDVTSEAPEEFRSPDGSSALTTSNPLLKAALIALRDTRPHSLSFDDLWMRAQSLLEGHQSKETGRDVGPHEIREALLRGYLSNLIDLQIAPHRLTTEISERPFASPLARFQAEQGERVTNLRRRTVELDGFDQLVLRTLDGTNDHAAILRSLMELAASEEFTIYEGDAPIRDLARIEAMFGAEIEPCLSRLANLALLVR